ncbi:methyltransferase domain-containing protein [Limibacillus halophilus]
MHDTAMEFGRLFFETYLAERPGAKILDVGSQDLNGSLRDVAPTGCEYVGLDFAAGKGVDIILEDPYSFPVEVSSFDACVASSCLEHSEFFWLSFLEMLRVLKPGGLLYLNVPSNGAFHRHPVDCWRFYPDSGEALARCGRRNGHDCLLLESFLAEPREDIWYDFVGVFLKDRSALTRYPARILDSAEGCFNARIAGEDEVLRHKRFWGESANPEP